MKLSIPFSLWLVSGETVSEIDEENLFLFLLLFFFYFYFF